jgi:membrane-anchored protein YejM (alkaline phosphatase superfamily)
MRNSRKTICSTDNDSAGKVARGTLLRWVSWFLFANAFILMLISFSYLKSMTFPETTLAKVFLGIAYPGHFFSLAFYIFPLMAIATAIYPVRRFLFCFSIFLATVLLLTIIVDSMVFAQYRFHLNGMIWNMLTSGAAQDILPLTKMLWVISALAITVIALTEWLLARFIWNRINKEHTFYGLQTGILIAIVVISGQLLHAWADANHRTDITRQVRYLPAYKPLTMKRLLVKLGLASEQNRNGLRVNNESSALRYPLEPIRCPDKPVKTNVLLIVLDSWRSDSLSAEITPNIWRFSKDNWRFSNHFSSGNATRFGIFGLFYGLYGTYWHSILAEEKSPVLMREFEKRQYKMKILGSAPLINPEFDRTVFSNIRNTIELRQTNDGSVTNDRVIAKKMIDFIASNPKDTPFFGFLFFDSPHVAGHPEEMSPFQPELKEVNHMALNNSTDPVPYFNRYKNALYFNDKLVGEVLEQLKKSNQLENTVVLITGDHGEEFNDLKMNYWGHVGNFSRFQTQTPLVIHWPGKKAEVYTHTTSHLDIAPTLMKDLFACETDASKFSNGRLLLDQSPRPYILLSSWDTFSTNELDRITVVQKSGEIDILDKSYKPIPGAKVRPEISKSAMEGMGRFYAR